MSRADDTSELDRDELALLAAFRAEESPSASALDRVRERVLTSAAPAPTAGVIRGPWRTWAAVAVLAAAAAAVLAIDFGRTDATSLGRDQGTQAADTPDAERMEPAASRRPPPSRARAGIEGAEAIERPDDPEPTLEPPPAPSPPVPEPPRGPRVRPTPRPTAQPDRAPQPESSLAAETRLLDRARQAVAAGRPTDALAILREAASRFPDGVLVQERAALRVVAMCDAGRYEAGREAAAAFMRSHPRSALRPRVESACAED